MTATALQDRIKFTPRPADPAAAARTWEDLAATDAAAAEALKASESASALLTGVFGCSPYLARAAARRPAALAAMLSVAPETALDGIVARAVRAAEVEEEEEASVDAAALDKALRLAKLDLHLLIALCDVGRVWPLETVTGGLTRFADAAVAAALAAHTGGRPEGLAAIAMGKQGAGELNYSSDIDLVVLFDREKLEARGVADPQGWANKATRAAVRSLNDLTPEGYVFRADLRLRPDPGATPPAVNVASALHYYEALGQTWERSAFIKARACAGDFELAEGFLEEIAPFIWRKSLDYAALDDLHAMKRQVQTHAGGLRPRAPGADVKRGYGGIREIEFFVQAHQLIHGGRDRRLRCIGTIDGLEALAAAGHVSAADAEALVARYRMLRDVEHRIQMINDAQTHIVPKVEAERERVASILGMPLTEFDANLRECFEDVRARTDQLFAETATEQNSVRVGAVDDTEEALEALRARGFERPEQFTQTVRAWRAGRTPATRSDRARALLDRIVPDLVDAAAATGDPDAAIVRFAEFFENLHAGVQTLSMFASEPNVLRVVVDVLSIAPKLGATLARQPELLDVMIDADFRRSVVETAEIDAARVAEAVAAAEGFESELNAARRAVRESRFRIGVQSLIGVVDAQGAGAAHAVLAEAATRALLEASRAEMSRRHGAVEGGFAVLALGKFGGRELSFASDLDLVAVYEATDATTGSSGPRSIGPDTYFARLTQRLITALSASTEEGDLYEVDMQLRPSGNAGPIASRLSAFEAYYESSAWTWELMALTRARPVAGDPALCDRLERLIEQVLRQPRETAAVCRDVADMRARMSAERPAKGAWDLKLGPGGLVDVEFALQALQLIHAAEAPEVLSPSSRDCLARLAARKLIAPADAEALGAALELQLTLSQSLSVAVEGVFDEAAAPERLKERLAVAAGCDDFETLGETLVATQAAACAVFERLVLAPAAEAAEDGATE